MTHHLFPPVGGERTGYGSRRATRSDVAVEPALVRGSARPGVSPLEELQRMLPQEIAERLKASDATVAERFDVVTVLFADIVGFTSFAQSHEPDEVVDLLNGLFSEFDDLVSACGVEKIKTLGDGYMVAGGVPVAHPDHTPVIADLALEMIDATEQFAAGGQDVGSSTMTGMSRSAFSSYSAKNG